MQKNLDTSFVQGIPVVVSNPLQGTSSRKEAVKVTLESNAVNFSVFDKNGTYRYRKHNRKYAESLVRSRKN